MSAWIVEKGHIDCLVQAALVEGLIELSDASETGRMLWDENHRSVSYRYSHLPEFPQYAPRYTFKGVEAPLDPYIVRKQIGCYDYQTCETPDYGETEAYDLIQRLWKIYAARTDDNVYQSRDDLPWGISDISEAVLDAVGGKV